MQSHSLVSGFLSLLILLGVSACSAGLNEKQVGILKELEGKASHTRLRVDQKLSENPESLLRDSLTVLDSVLEYTESIKGDPQRFNPGDVKAYQLKLAIINENIERFSDLKLQADVSFPLGAYDLSDYARQASDVLVDKLATALKELTEKYPGHQIRLILKATGYTDEVPIVSGSQLATEVLNEIDSLAGDAAAKRAQMNEVLSRFRANALHDYLLHSLKQRLPEHFNQLEIVSHIIGQGETLPSGVQPEPAYQRKDERRRVCIVSPFIEVVP